MRKKTPLTDKDKILAEIDRLIALNEEYKWTWRWKISWFRKTLIGRLETLEGLRNFIKEIPDNVSERNDAAEKYASDIDSVYRDFTKNVFIEGAKWQKEQILKGAVNAGIYEASEDDQDDIPTLHAISEPLNDVDFGDNVKVVIFKDDEIVR